MTSSNETGARWRTDARTVAWLATTLSIGLASPGCSPLHAEHRALRRPLETSAGLHIDWSAQRLGIASAPAGSEPVVRAMFESMAAQSRVDVRTFLTGGAVRAERIDGAGRAVGAALVRQGPGAEFAVVDSQRRTLSVIGVPALSELWADFVARDDSYSVQSVTIERMAESRDILGLSCERSVVRILMATPNPLVGADLEREIRLDVWHARDHPLGDFDAAATLVSQVFGPTLEQSMREQVIPQLGLPLDAEVVVTSWMGDGKTPEHGSFHVKATQLDRRERWRSHTFEAAPAGYRAVAWRPEGARMVSESTGPSATLPLPGSSTDATASSRTGDTNVPER